jgi:hypothetical protein
MSGKGLSNRASPGNGASFSRLHAWEHLMPDTFIVVVLTILLVAAAYGSFRNANASPPTGTGSGAAKDPVYEWDDQDWSGSR